jgi:hypothetical protein
MTEREEMAEKAERRTPTAVVSGLRSRARIILSALSVLSALSAFSTPAPAQFFAFGQNKIQYRRLEWRIIRGPHVDLYYYPAEAELAPAALAYAVAC